MIRAKQAKKILPKGEFEHFEGVIQNQISRASESSLKKKATVSRRLRDKYRDLARHQTVQAKRKLTNSTDVSQNEARADIFQGIIDRIEGELERPNRRARKPSARTVSKATKKVADANSRERAAKKSMSEAKHRSR